MVNDFSYLIGWLVELIFASWLLSEGTEHLSRRWGARFVGRTLLSIATTLPEIAIVVAAANHGSYDTAIGSALGSNLFMMTFGLAVMLIIATTRISKAPQKFIDVKEFKMDKVLLIVSSVVGTLFFIDGYDFIDAIVFSGLFVTYLFLAFREARKERESEKVSMVNNSMTIQKQPSKNVIRSLVFFVSGVIGIFLGAEPFVHSLEGTATDIGISVAILAIIVSPIAAEMPEKISMIFLARKGTKGVSVSVANVLGSKILNNTLLLAIAVFAAMSYKGFTTKIPNTPLLEYQMILVTVITILSIIPMFRGKLGMRYGIMLLGLYGAGIGLQFALP